jgi:hypothetical protein
MEAAFDGGFATTTLGRDAISLVCFEGKRASFCRSDDAFGFVAS